MWTTSELQDERRTVPVDATSFKLLFRTVASTICLCERTYRSHLNQDSPLSTRDLMMVHHNMFLLVHCITFFEQRPNEPTAFRLSLVWSMRTNSLFNISRDSKSWASAAHYWSTNRINVNAVENTFPRYSIHAQYYQFWNLLEHHLQSRSLARRPLCFLWQVSFWWLLWSLSNYILSRCKKSKLSVTG